MINQSVRRSVPVIALVASATVGVPVRAGARQFHVGPSIGFDWSAGTLGSTGGTITLDPAYDITDAWRLYGSAHYGLGLDGRSALRHAGSATLGVAYVLDVLSVMPWIGVGIRGSVVFGAANAGIPAVDARLGVDYRPSRYFAWTVQVAYDLSIWNRDAVSDEFSASLGARWTLDL